MTSKLKTSTKLKKHFSEKICTFILSKALLFKLSTHLTNKRSLPTLVT